MTVLETNPSDAFANDRKHVFHSWSAQGALNPAVVTRAEGSYFWTEDGTRYLDFSSQLVNVNIGHQHPKLVAAIQEQADKALRDGLIAYDRRHGWRGPHAKIADMSVPWEEEFARIQQRRPLFGPSSWQLAVVTKVDAGSATIAGLPDNADGTIPFAEMTWARQSLPNQNVGAAPARPAALLSVGDVVVVEKIEKNEAEFLAEKESGYSRASTPASDWLAS